MRTKLTKWSILILVFLLGFNIQGSVQAEKVLIVVQATDAANIDFDQTSVVGRLSGVLVYDWQWLRFQTVESDLGALYSHPTNLIPGIIQSWKTIVNPDGTAVQRLVIRPGAKFHSGNPVTVADLKYTMLRRAALGKWNLHITVGGMYGPDLGEIDGTVRIINDYTMEIDVVRPMLSFWETWAQRWYWDSKLMKENATEDDPWSKEFATKNDAGSGPYVIEKWTPGVEMVFKRFDGYWGQRPSIDKIILRVVPDISSRVMLLKSGAVDVALDLTTQEFDVLKDDPNIKIISAPNISMLSIMMNLNIEPFDNKNLRWALTYAFPYDDIIPAVYSGNAQPFYGPIPTNVNGALSDRKYKTDLDKSREYLKMAGYENGLTIKLQYESGFEEHEKIGLLYQANLKKIGVDLKLQRLPAGQHSTGKYQKTLPFFITEGTPWIATAEYMFRLNFMKNTPSNFIGYENDLVEELLPQVILETNPIKKAELNKKIQNEILEDAVWIYIAQPDFRLAMRKNIVGYIAQNTRFHHWWDVDKIK